MALSKKQLAHVCLQGCGAQQCRYLGFDQKFTPICTKLLTQEKKNRDKMVSTHFADCRKQGIDPWANPFSQVLYVGSGWSGYYVGLGDGAGCSGYPQLSKVTQGYDVSNGSTGNASGQPSKKRS